MAFVGAANLAGADPTDLEPIRSSASRNNQPAGIYDHGLHKPSLSEYRYWARLKRQSEMDGTSMNGLDDAGRMLARPAFATMIKNRKGRIPADVKEEEDPTKSEHLGEKKKEAAVDVSVIDMSKDRMSQYAGLSQDEASRLTMRRQLRLASWAMMFYLITTDILGPFNAPYAIANMGLVPGIICYIFFGFIASMTGFMCGHLFCKLDSDRFPIRTYGDIAQRVVGPWFKYACSILQSIQLVVNVGLICLSSGQSLYQSAHDHPCFSVAVVIWALIGMIAGQIRSLRNFALIGQTSVFINLTIIVVSMAVIAHTEPNKAVANAANDTLGYGPVFTQAFNSQDLVGQVNGMYNLVFAYGGAMIFPEMISEMRRPMDFWKGLVCADSLIMVCYLFYGVFFYCFAGQYTQANAFQGLSPYWAQTFCNVLNMVSGMIAAVLYGNIGVKVIYVNIVQDMLKGPPMNSKKGRLLWTGLVPLYWSIAFVVANSIPALGAMTGLIGAVCIFQFSYTFPPLLWLIYHLRVHAETGVDQAYTGFGTEYVKGDSWRSVARWRRAWLGTAAYEEDGPTELPTWVTRLSHDRTVMFLAKVAMAGIFLACLACSGLGFWGTGEAIRQAFEQGQATAFGCLANA